MQQGIVLIKVGEIKVAVLRHLSATLAQTFGCACRIGVGLPAPTYAYHPRRAQYAAEMILAQLPVGEHERVLGIADYDLYVPGLNFVFGLADPNTRRALIALPRLRPSYYGQPEDTGLFLARTAKEAVHELGHTYGLGHCRNRRCVMAFSNSLADTDTKEQEFCPICREKIQPTVE